MPELALGICLAGLIAGVLLYLSPAVTPEQFGIWMLLGIIILFVSIPVSLLVLVTTVYPVFRAVRNRAPRRQLLVALWLGSATIAGVMAGIFIYSSIVYG